jgi:TPR repeat protein
MASLDTNNAEYMVSMGVQCYVTGKHEEEVKWYQKAADLGYPSAMHYLAVSQEEGEGTEQNMESAIAWYTRAADAGYGPSMLNLSFIHCQGGGYITRDRFKSLEFSRKAADAGVYKACCHLAFGMYLGSKYFRTIGLIDLPSPGGSSWVFIKLFEVASALAELYIKDGHDIPKDVMTSILLWLHRGEVKNDSVSQTLNAFKEASTVGSEFCYNDNCTVKGLLKQFKVCPNCRTAHYCSRACQKDDWVEHKKVCGTFAAKTSMEVAIKKQIITGSSGYS